MKIAVSVESTNDLTKELLKEYDISVIPFQITLGDKTFYDGEMSTEDLFKSVNKNGVLPKTNAINEYEYSEYFKKLKEKYDAVIHICLSSGITSTTTNARAAAKNVGGVYIVDSLTLSTGIGLLAIYARKLAEKGIEPTEIARIVQERTGALQVSFVVERMDYLYKGGRCNGFQLLGANLLKIRPRIVLKNGKMLSDKKYRGDMNAVIAKYSKEIFTEFNTPDTDMVFVTYTSATPEMHDAAINACKERGFKNIYQTFAGGTVASHCGEHTLGIIYFNDGNR